MIRILPWQYRSHLGSLVGVLARAHRRLHPVSTLDTQEYPVCNPHLTWRTAQFSRVRVVRGFDTYVFSHLLPTWPQLRLAGCVGGELVLLGESLDAPLESFRYVSMTGCSICLNSGATRQIVRVKFQPNVPKYLN